MSKRGHGGHHGGAWKVAYADFVTSMMALFLVLWLVSADPEIRQSVQDYFRGEMKRPGGEGIMRESKKGLSIHKNQDVSPKDLIILQELQRTIQKLEKLFKNTEQPGDDLIRFEYLADGVRIIAIDRAKRPFFNPGTAELTDFGKWILHTIAWEIERYPFLIEVEGHTQKGGEGGEDSKTWNLSTFRAIHAKDELSENGVQTGRFWRVAGYSDRIPIDPKTPENEQNRRISIVIRKADDATSLYKSDELKQK